MFRDLSATIRKEPRLRGIIFLHLALFLACISLPRSSDFYRQIMSIPWDLVELFTVACVLLWSVGTLANRREQFFWRYLAYGFGFWFLANTTAFVTAGQEKSPSGILADTFVSSLYLAYYLSLVFATEEHPERRESAQPRSVEERLNLWGAVLFTFALLLYFVHIPMSSNPENRNPRHLTPILYVWLDLFIAGRFAFLSLASPRPRWQVLYRVLFLAFSGFALAKGLEALTPQGWWPPTLTEHYTLWDILWAVPFLLTLFAARLRHHLPEDDIPATLDIEGTEVVAGLWLYTIAFPLMHLLLHYIDQDDPASHALRDVLVIAYFLVLGGMALVQHRHRDERRQRAEQELRDSEHNYRQLVESTHHAILVVGATQILDANTRARHLFDLEQTPLPGSFESLGLPEPMPQQPDSVENKPISIEVQRRKGEGRKQTLEMTCRSISYLGGPAWQLMVHDTTALNRLRQQNRRMVRLASLGNLATDFTNQIRPSLSALASGWHQLSQRLPLDFEEQDDFDLAIERIERLVGNVHDFSSVEDPSFHQHDLVQILSSAIRSLRETFASSGVEIRPHFGHRHALVQADRHQILQVFTNVLENAHLAMPNGGEVLVETLNQPGAIEIVITDSGDGIAIDHQERIFDPFYTTRSGGTGLGLAVVARILGRHGCWHSVDSEPGKGTRFTLSFPLAELEVAP